MSTAYKNRIQEFKVALSEETIDLKNLRGLCFNGIPFEGGIRALCWKVLLNYLPPDQLLWETFLKKQRELYSQFLKEMIIQPGIAKANLGFSREDVTMEDHVSSPGKPLSLYPSNEYEVLPKGSEAHWEVVERILFIYAKLNPGIAYVQGMNEIVGPIYYTFATDPNSQWKEHAEADTFFSFTNLMSENRDNFIKSLDDSQCGITYKMESVYSMLKEKDLELYLKLEEQNIKPHYFTFRWLTLLLSQEFLLPDVIRIWDTLFSDEDRFHFLILVCCAMLTLIRDKLLAGDFTVNMRLLQDYPISDVHTILTKAKELQDNS
ncbi:TBC1 domain family member 13 isoform X2 [Channa argus]|uniref:TBC1 domain family member 13 isoform X2 n=1 Tax=Channa argus TaxID=215402 RepID=UPI0035224C0A